MPLLLVMAIPAIFTTGAVLIKTASNEFEDTVNKTAPNLIMVGAGLLALYAAYVALNKGKT